MTGKNVKIHPHPTLSLQGRGGFVVAMSKARCHGGLSS